MAPMRKLLTVFVALVALFACGCDLPDDPAPRNGVTAGTGRAPSSAIASVPLASLPPEARETLVLIRAGGPFPYERDGAVFVNFERRLPDESRGYWKEYTVRTPGASDRGARRIVAGAGGEAYYSDDHYATFRRIEE